MSGTKGLDNSLFINETMMGGMGMHASIRRARVLVAFCLVAGFIAASARISAGSEWIGGHGDNWSEPLNWLGGVPTAGDLVTLRLRTSTPPFIFQDLTGGVV